MNKTVINRLNEIEKRIALGDIIEKKTQEFWDFVNYALNNPAPNRNIHDFESED